MEREFTRSRETEAKLPDFYESTMKFYADRRNMYTTGKVVIKGSERPWEKTRQAILKHFFHHDMGDSACRDWLFFQQDIRSKSGKHRHQGGLCIYVVEGKGWTTVDEVRHDWEEGDLILLPIKPEGVVHQHFNAEPGKPCVWLAMIYLPWVNAFGNELEQKEAAPDWEKLQQHA